jgi:hypothetical protein
LSVSITIFINITPIPARVFFSIFSPAAGLAFRSVFVFFVSSLSFLPINAVSISSSSPSFIKSLSSLICSDLAAKYAEFKCDYSLLASSILSLIPNVSDTDFLIKLTTFRDALICLSPAAFDAIVKMLAIFKLSGPAQKALDLCLSPNEKYRIGALAFLIHELDIKIAYIKRD